MTYSIVARDSETGQLGVAVQSRWFSVGRIVTWAEAGVGAVATQAFAEPAYGPRGLELMRNGLAAPDALRALVSVDSGAAVRQVTMLDAHGHAAAHTGSDCVPACGHHLAEGVSAQANMVERESVWNATVDGYASGRVTFPIGSPRRSRPPKHRAGTSAAASRRPSSSSRPPGPATRPRTSSSSCESKMPATPSRSSGGCSPFSEPTTA